MKQQYRDHRMAFRVLILAAVVSIVACVAQRTGPDAGPDARTVIRSADRTYWSGVATAFRAAAVEAGKPKSSEDDVLKLLDISKPRDEAKKAMNEYVSSRLGGKWSPAKAAKVLAEIAAAADAEAKK